MFKNQKKYVAIVIMTAAVFLCGCSMGASGIKGGYTAETWYHLNFSGSTCTYSNEAYGYTWKGSYILEDNNIKFTFTDNGGNEVEKDGTYDKEADIVEMEGRTYVKD